MKNLIMQFVLVALAAATPPIALDVAVRTRSDPSLRCRLGIYVLPDRGFLAIAGSDGHPRNLKYTRSGGGLGMLVEQADGSYVSSASPPMTLRFESCDAGVVRLENGARSQLGRHTPLVVQETTFHSGAIDLHGKLVLPPNGKAKAVAVWVGGSNNDPDTDDASWQFELARRGIGVFVYDKRGTGSSGGALTADFYARAADTAAAVKEARRLAPHVEKVGVIGASQGGWVAPLTATLTPLDFVIPAFAMAEGPPAQDRAVVMDQLRRGGFDGAVLRKAAKVTAATERVVRSNFTEGFELLEALKLKYAGEPWIASIGARSYTGVLLHATPKEAREFGPSLSQGLNFNYEPAPIIETIKPRQLWLLGGRDHQAPSAGTISILRNIQHTRPDLDMIIFPEADHGLIEPFHGTTGETTSYPLGLFDLLSSWILTGLATCPDARRESNARVDRST